MSRLNTYTDNLGNTVKLPTSNEEARILRWVEGEGPSTPERQAKCDAWLAARIRMMRKHPMQSISYPAPETVQKQRLRARAQYHYDCCANIDKRVSYRDILKHLQADAA